MTRADERAVAHGVSILARRVRADTRGSEPRANPYEPKSESMPSSLRRRAIASHSLRALRFPTFRAWMAAGLVSVAGSWMQMVAQNWVMLQHTGSGAMVGLTLAVQAAPSLMLGMWAGGVVDRVDRRRLLVVTQSTLAALAVAMAVVVAAGWTSVGALLILSAITGCVTVFDGPASGALGASLLPPDDLANGLALGSIVSSMGRVGGMAAAGLAVAAVGPAAACGVNALTFLAPIVVLLRLGPSPTAPAVARAREHVWAGVRHVWALPEVRATLAMAWICGCFGRNFQVTSALMAERVFSGGAGLYGMFSTAFAVGTVVGGVVAARLRHLSRHVLISAATLAAVLQIASGTTRSVGVFVVILAMIGAAAVVLDTTVGARVQLATDPTMRGRVLAVCALVGGTSGMVGGPLLGWMGQHAGAQAPLLVGGSVALVAASSFGWRAAHQLATAQMRRVPAPMPPAALTAATTHAVAPAAALRARRHLPRLAARLASDHGRTPRGGVATSGHAPRPRGALVLRTGLRRAWPWPTHGSGAASPQRKSVAS
jgi:MFS family permease